MSSRRITFSVKNIFVLLPVAILLVASWSLYYFYFVHSAIVLNVDDLSFSNLNENYAEETVNTTQTSHASYVHVTSESRAETERDTQKHKTTLNTTTSCAREYFLLILVSSSPDNGERRRNIRKTWGVDYAIKPRWKTIFLVAQPRVQRDLNSRLAKEDATFGDLVRANFFEDYWNQTLKIQMGFEWAHRYCKFSFLLKMDDDVFVNMKALLSLLNKPSTPRKTFFMGNHYKNPNVHRDGKWKVTFEEYSQPTYPSFCPGLGYVLSADVVAIFVNLLHVVPAFRLDDVYVGMLANKGGINITHNEGFVVHGPSDLGACNLHENTLVWHGVIGDCLFKLYGQTLN